MNIYQQFDKEHSFYHPDYVYDFENRQNDRDWGAGKELAILETPESIRTPYEDHATKPRQMFIKDFIRNYKLV